MKIICLIENLLNTEYRILYKIILVQPWDLKLFEKTGCLMTADGEDDEKVRPQGLEPYKFQSMHTVMCMDIQSCAWTYLDTLQSWTLGIPFETLHSYKS